MADRTFVDDVDNVNRSSLLTWFTATLQTGSTKKLSLEDLPVLPANFQSDYVKRQFQFACASRPSILTISPRVSVTNESTHSEKWATHLSSAEEKNKLGVPALVRAIIRCYGVSIAKVGLLKVLTTVLSFVGPVLLGLIVKYLENVVTQSNLPTGILLIALLGGSSVLSALLSTNYNIRTAVIKNNMQGALIRVIFSRCLSLPIVAKMDIFLSDSQVNNLVQVDIDQVSNCFKSIHDLWALPVQIIVACVLLYLNIQVAFLAGVVVIIIMIPLNSLIAKRIGTATESLMKAKDARVKVITEALGNVISLKMAGLEGAVLNASGEHRDKELRYLGHRKYLDAICVFLWALTPVIVPFVTFLSTVYLNVELTASEVVTALALLNMLIFPMNALPWVINGFMEARVSLRRLAKVLTSEDGETLFVNNRFVRKNRHKVKFIDAKVFIPTDAADGGWNGDGTGAGDGRTAFRTSSSSELGGRASTSSGGGRSRGRQVSRSARQPSGEERRGELVLSIPATVWSWATAQQVRELESPDEFEAGDVLSPLLSAVAAGGDVEDQLRAPLIDHAADTYRGSLGGDRGSLRESRAAGPGHGVVPFAVSINEVKLTGGQLLGVVGPTASGKTSLLLGILGEIRGHKKHPDGDLGGEDSLFHNASFNASFNTSFNDSMNASSQGALQLVRAALSEHASRRRTQVCTGNVAYCPQVPAMHAGSIRSNILMGSEYDEQRYQEVLDGCCLYEDLQNGSWAKGDLTEVGSGGSNLSGGQRLRIGVARAVYAYSCDLLLLDDPYSALDSSTAQRLCAYLNDVVQRECRTIILTTHSVSHLQRAHLILVLQQGEEVSRGTYTELQASSQVFQSLLGEQIAASLESSAVAGAASSTDTHAPRTAAASVAPTSPTGIRASESEQDVPYDEKLEFSATGYLERKVYWAYFAAVGLGLTALIVLTTVVMQATSIGLSFWWAYWATHQDDFNRRDFVLISSGLVVVAVTAGLLRALLFAQGGLRAARALYERLALAVFHTDMRFFEVTAIGRLTNRFGKDSNTIDDSLPFIMNILLAQTFLLLGSCVVIAVSDPPILLLFIIVAVIYHRMQKFYRKSSRELRRLDSVHKSPVYTVFLECVASAPILRGFGEHCVLHFDALLQGHLDKALRVALSVEVSSQWLGVRLQLLGALITTVLAVTIVLNALYSVFPMNAGMAGLSLIYSFTIVNNLNGFLNALSETEQEMVSVERVTEYCDLPNEYGEYVLQLSRKQPPGGAGGLCGGVCACLSCCGSSCCKKAEDGKVATNAMPAGYAALTPDEPGNGTETPQGLSATGLFSPRRTQQGPRDTVASVVLQRSTVSTDGLSFGGSLSASGASSVLYRVLSRNQEGLVFEHVSMSYEPPADQRVSFSPPADCLKDISVTIRPGSRVAIVGRTGSGKSSLLRVLLRINEYHSGTITLSGVELRSIPKQRLRCKLSVIPQKPLLFSGTIRFNLDPVGEFSEADLSIALEMCKFAQTLSNGGAAGTPGERRSDAMVSVERFTDVTLRSSGSSAVPIADTTSPADNTLLDFVLIDGGANLSVGQQQLLCLARALLRRSDLILVDEATAAVDSHTESLLFASLAQYVAATGASMLMVCHKTNGISRVCNQIMTLDGGRIVSYEDC